MMAKSTIKVTTESLIQAILDFWFKENGSAQWFAKNPDFDRQIRDRFQSVFADIVAGKHAELRETARGCLAEIIVLDQFSRNMYRDDARAFFADPRARDCLAYALAKGFDRALSQQERNFLYLPFEHSEDPADQEKSIQYFTENGDKNALDYALRHKEIIDRFGRYPHRNAILGRQSTEAECAFLAQPGSSF